MRAAPTTDMGTSDAAPNVQQERVLDAAILLLSREGRDALTTRSVAAAAGVQAPTLYRLFGDKRGLLDAVAAYGYAAYLKGKQKRVPGGDPLDDLRAGWDQHVEFGLTHPAVYTLMVGDPRPDDPSPADAAGRVHLQQKVRALALAGRLKVSEERATALMHASCSGLVLTLISMPEDRRDPGLSALARESVMAAIATGSEGDTLPAKFPVGLAGAAVTLKAVLPGNGPLTPGERALLGELLDRLAVSKK
ncbi:TetR/AcrR family transcriptional regulator (plasmid) [Deinococcus radiomollis]|uniref:TetR/AcrR family transcriptional regulator n=1 Tax=Deinococcus radiomollis TaxID=468916 RepID=UPI003892C4D5